LLTRTLNIQPDEFANYFSAETGENVLIGQVRFFLSYALLLVGRCDYGDGVLDRPPNPFSACLMMTARISFLSLLIASSSGIAITLRSRIRGSNRFIPSSSCPRRSDAAIGLTQRRPDAQYNKAAWLRQARFSEKLSRLSRGG
jgi:hypothetical protein